MSGQVDRLFGGRRRWPRPRLDVTDRELEQCLVDHGFPREHTFTQYRHTLPRQYEMLRDVALRFYYDTVQARRGDKQAKERVDFLRETWQAQARERETVTGRSQVIIP